MQVTRCNTLQFQFSHQVVKLLSVPPSSNSSATESPEAMKQQLLGLAVCQLAFKKLLGIGSSRFWKLKRAAREGVAPPVDARTHPKKLLLKSQPHALRKRAYIVEFLENLYQTLSEPMPETQAGLKEVADHGKAAASTVKEMEFRRLRGKRPKLARVETKASKDASLRLLPPGSFSDYLKLLRAKYPTEKFSLKLFNNAP